MGAGWGSVSMMGLGMLASSQFSLSELGGVLYWFDAASLVGYSDGASISSVPDISGYGHTGTATNLKFYSSSATTPNGGPCVGNPSADWNWTIPVFMSGGAAEAFAYYRPAPTGYRQLFQNFGTNTEACHFPYTDNYVYDGFGIQVRLSSSPTAFGVTVDSAHWYGFSLYSASSQGYGIFRGTTLIYNGGGGAVTTVWKSSGNHQIGGNTRHMLAEIVVFDKKLTTAERAQMHAYFAAKHGTPG